MGQATSRSIGGSGFAYDPASRLITANLWDGTGSTGTPLKTQTYTYDLFGNLQAIGGLVGRNTPTSSITNRLNGAGMAYDAAGNLTSNSGALHEYDPLHLMWHFQSGAEDWRYVYTADDERIWSFKTGGSSRWTLRDLGNNVLREYANNGGAWSVTEDFIRRGGQLLASDTLAGVSHFHLDHLGTPRLVTDQTGKKVAYHVYWPYGEELTLPNQDAERMKFTGHERDLNGSAGTGDDLDYMHARFCSPVTGRFLGFDSGQTNPMQAQSWNRYTYTLGNPVKYIDPDGNEVQVFGSPAFRTVVDGALRQLEKSNPRLMTMIVGLRDSKNVHRIIQTKPDTAVNRVNSQADADNGHGTGSDTFLSEVGIDETGEIVPVNQLLAHELSHAEDADTGTRMHEPACAGCASKKEAKAVRMENLTRDEKRTKYGQERVPDPGKAPPNPRLKRRVPAGGN